jgi:hypothetical protein
MVVCLLLEKGVQMPSPSNINSLGPHPPSVSSHSSAILYIIAPRFAMYRSAVIPLKIALHPILGSSYLGDTVKHLLPISSKSPVDVFFKLIILNKGQTTRTDLSHKYFQYFTPETLI